MCDTIKRPRTEQPGAFYYLYDMAKAKKVKKKKDTSINLPKEDIKVEPGQLTFLPALQKVVKKKPAKQ